MSLALVPEGRTLSVRRDEAVIATLRLGVPGEPVPSDDPDVVVATRAGDLLIRVRVFDDLDDVSLIVTVDHTGSAAAELPALGLALEPSAGWSAWAWTGDTDAVVVVTSTDGAPGALAMTLRQGFARVEPQRPVFGPEPRPASLDGASLTQGAGAFHLAPVGAALAPGRRFATVLRFGEIADAAAAASLLPGWLPELVVAAGTEVLMRTPDVGVVPGPGVNAVLVDDALALSSDAGHREVAVHGVRGVTTLRMTWAPALEPWLAEYAHALRSRRPSAVTSATGAVVAEALARRAVLDADAALDWLECGDWLARGDLLGVAAAAVVAVENIDVWLLEDAWAALAKLPVSSGFGLVTMRLWLATITLTSTARDLGADQLGRPAPDADTALELGLLGHRGEEVFAPLLAGAIDRLGGVLPGQPLGLPASDAARLISVLRLCPEGWRLRRLASDTAEKATALLLADYADGHHRDLDGLAWLLVGGLGN